MNVRIKFEVRSFTHSWDNRGYSKNLGSPCRPCSLFSKIFHGLWFGWTLWIYRPNSQSVALPFREIIAIALLGCGCEPQSWERGGRRGSGMIPFERALVSSYMPSIVTFPLSSRVSEILSHLCSSTNFPNFNAVVHWRIISFVNLLITAWCWQDRSSSWWS